MSLHNDNQDQQKKPRRPRTAYNFFFQSERKNILLEAMKKEKNSDGGEMSPTQIMNVLQTDKHRPHRKLHGMVSFRDLTTRVSSKWRSLDPLVKKVYQDLSSKDKIRYREEIKAWRDAQLDQGNLHSNSGPATEDDKAIRGGCFESITCVPTTLVSTVQQGIYLNSSQTPNYISYTSDDDESSRLNSINYKGAFSIPNHKPLRRVVSCNSTATSSSGSSYVSGLVSTPSNTTNTTWTTRMEDNVTNEANTEPISLTTGVSSDTSPLYQNNVNWLASKLDSDCLSFLISLKD